MRENCRLCLCGIMLIMLALSFEMSAQAHNEYFVKGELIDSISGESEPFATVKVYDSSKQMQKPLKVDVTDADGKFYLPLMSAGKYRITFSVVGKKPAMREFVLDAGNKSVDFGKIDMSNSENVLGELVVEASRPLVKSEIDKITYDLEADPDAKTNSLIEMLRKVPMVTVDGEENIKVNGSGSFKVLVNGKPNTMMSNNPKEVFRSMPANSMKRIEVVTDPGAKYDAEGVGGVLNIITTDAKIQGYNLTVNANADNNGAGGGAYATAQMGKFTVSANVNYNHQFSHTTGSESMREDFNNDEFHFLNDIGKNKSKNNFMYGSIEASYELDSLNLFTLSGNVFGGRYTTNSASEIEMNRVNGERRYAYNQNSWTSSDFGSTNLGFDYQHSFKKPEELLTVSYRLDYSPNGSKSETNYDNLYDVPYLLSNQKYDNDAHTEEHTVQVDYVNPLTDKHYIDFGGKYIYRKNYSDVAKWVADDAGTFVKSDDPTNKYSQLRNIVAAYADYKLKLGAFGAKAGVRYEYTFMDVKYDLSHERDYSAHMSDLVPSALLSYNIGMMQTLKLSYAMRINRPGISYLNPYVDNSTPMSIRYGNPDLDTEKNHSIGVSINSFSQKLMINGGVSYSFSNNGIERYQTLADGVMRTTYGNISKRKSLNADAWINYTPWAKTRITINFNGGYFDYKSAQLDLHNSGFSMFCYGSVQQTLPKDINLTVYGGGSNRSKDFQTINSGMHFYGMSVSKSFLKDKRLNVSLRVNNPFKKNIRYSSVTRTDDFYSSNVSYYPTRSFGVNVSWRFGDLKTSVKRTERSISNDDVMSSGNSGSAGGGASSGGR